MSLSHLRDSIIKHLTEAADSAANRAINMRVHAATQADGYALTQADCLSEARTYTEAARIVLAEYKKMTETPVVETPGEPQITAVKDKMYG